MDRAIHILLENGVSQERRGCEGLQHVQVAVMVQLLSSSTAASILYDALVGGR